MHCICRPVGGISGSCDLKMPNSRSDGTGDGGMHARAHKMALLCRVENRECRRQHSSIDHSIMELPRDLPRDRLVLYCTECSAVQNTNWAAAAQQVWPAEDLDTCDVWRCGGSTGCSLVGLQIWKGTLALPDRPRPAAGCRSMDVGRAWRELWLNFGCKMQATTQHGFFFSFCVLDFCQH